MYNVFQFLFYMGFLSADEDECKEYSPCTDHAMCFNTIGSYYCQCLSGFNNTKGFVNFTGVDEGQCLGKHVYVCVRMSDIYLSIDIYHTTIFVCSSIRYK